MNHLCPVIGLFLVMSLSVGCHDDALARERVPDSVTMTITCRDPDNQEKAKDYPVTDTKRRARIVSALRKLDWSQDGQNLAEIRMTMPDVDIVIENAAGKVSKYQFYWRGDSLLDQDTSRLLTTDVSALRKLVRLEAGRTTSSTFAAAVRMTVTFTDSSAVKQRDEVDVTNATLRAQIVTALNRIDFSMAGTPVNVAADMRAPEISLSMNDKTGVTRGVSFYWSASEGGAIIHAGVVHNVSGGMAELRELISGATGLAAYGRRQ